MIIQLEKNADKNLSKRISETLINLKFSVTPVTTQLENYLVCIGKNDFDIREIGHLPGVKDVHRVSDNYKLVSNKWKTQNTVIDLGDGVRIGDGSISIMAGPCSVENQSQLENITKHLLKNNIKIMRGGVYKPRSSPYAFRGLGIDGLKMMYDFCKPNGIKIISEVMQGSQIEEMYPYVDVFQVGARNSQNFNLLDALG